MNIKALIRYVEIDNNGNLTFRKKPKCEFNQMKVIVLTARHPLFGRTVLQLENGQLIFKYNDEAWAFLSQISSKYFAVKRVFSNCRYNYYLVSCYSKSISSYKNSFIKECRYMDIPNTPGWNDHFVESWKE